VDEEEINHAHVFLGEDLGTGRGLREEEFAQIFLTVVSIRETGEDANILTDHG